MTTIATVGYGDISAETTEERIFCIGLMIIGVIAFTFISGALSSILSNYDSSQAALQQKLLYFRQLKNKCNISSDLSYEIRTALNFDAERNMQGFNEFIHSLPVHLQMDITVEIHRELMEKYPLFQDIGNKHFLSWVY